MLFLVRLRFLSDARRMDRAVFLDPGGAVLGVFEWSLVFCGETYDQNVSDTRLKNGIMLLGQAGRCAAGSDARPARSGTRIATGARCEGNDERFKVKSQCAGRWLTVTCLGG
jgi:hypothetical protein